MHFNKDSKNWSTFTLLVPSFSILDDRRDMAYKDEPMQAARVQYTGTRGAKKGRGGGLSRVASPSCCVLRDPGITIGPEHLLCSHALANKGGRREGEGRHILAYKGKYML
jgi:hypothetical protein